MQKKPSKLAHQNNLLKRLGLYIQEAFLTAQECAELTLRMTTATGQAASVYGRASSAEQKLTTRRTSSVDLDAAHDRAMAERFTACRDDLARHFSIALSEHEPAQYLVYRAGSYYRPHRDRRALPAAPDDDTGRRISAVVFLSQPDATGIAGYAGGELRFFDLIDAPEWRGLGLTCEATPGLLVAFPSDVLHEVTDVTRGCRCTIATWFR